MTITSLPSVLVIKLNSGIELSIHGEEEYLTIDTPDKGGQSFDISLDVNGINCDGILLRKALECYSSFGFREMLKESSEQP